MKDYYQTLGISPEASMKDIQTAYRERSLKYHPDKNHGQDTTAKFQEISEAYQVLSDYHKRRQYDNNRGMEFDFMDPMIFFQNFMPNFMSEMNNLSHIPGMEIFSFSFPPPRQPKMNPNRMNPNRPSRRGNNSYVYSSSQSTTWSPKTGSQTKQTTYINDNGKEKKYIENTHRDASGQIVQQNHQPRLLAPPSIRTIQPKHLPDPPTQTMQPHVFTRPKPTNLGGRRTAQKRTK